MSSLTVLNHEIHQTDGLYCLNDLHKASGGLEKHQPAFFMRNQETKDLIAELEQETKVSSANLQTIIKKITGKGLHQGTYACKEIVYRYAMWISPKFALAVIRVFDAFITGNLEPKRIVLSPAQRKELANAVRSRCQGNKPHYQTVWRAVKEYFDVEVYEHILASDFDEALALIKSIQLPAIQPQIETSFNIKDFLDKHTNIISQYVYELEHAIYTLTGDYPKAPFDKDTIANGIIGYCLNHQKVQLNFTENGIFANLLPFDTITTTQSKIPQLIEKTFFSKAELDNIIQTSVKKLACKP